ncbi:MAG: prolyl oligopeptidase family serine peptidase [Phycisphaeraceae bacterium]
MKRWLTLLILISATTTLGDHHHPRQSAHSLNITVEQDLTLNYLLALPDGYNTHPNQHWPVVLFLHGAGERGDNLDKVKAWGPPKMIEQGETIPAIVISPQCPDDSWWPQHNDALIALLDDIEANYRVDTDRIYVTGLSMGGFGSWSLAGTIPDRIAAVVPICGGASWYEARRIGEHRIPLWAFHGEADNVVEVEESLRAMKSVRAAGHENVKLTIYPNGNHGAWIPAYADEDMWAWMFEQRLTDRHAEAE